MNSITEKKGLINYFSYKNEPGWLNIFIHVGFGVALLAGIGVLVYSLFFT